MNISNKTGDGLEPVLKIARQDEEYYIQNDEAPSDIPYNQNVLQMELDMRIIEGSPNPDKEKDPKKREILTERIKTKNEQKYKLHNCVCALRNSGGGVVLIKLIGSAMKGTYLNKFHKVFDGELKCFLFQEEEFLDVFKTNVLNDGTNLTLFVQGSTKIVTSETNAKRPLPRGIETVAQNEIFRYFPFKKCKKPEVISRWVSTHLHCFYPEEECESLQFKSYQNLKTLDRLKRKLRDDIRTYTSAFTRIPGGGSILFGIEEKSEKDNTIPTVIGLNYQLNSEEKKSDLLEHCRNIIEQKMMWVHSSDTNAFDLFQASKIRKYYDVHIHDVYDGSEEKQVLEVAVAHFEGLAFCSQHGPLAWKLENEDEMERFDPQEWFTLMRRETKNLDSKQKTITDAFLNRFQLLSINSGVLNPPEVYEIKGSVSDIQESIFRRRKPMALTPKPLVAHLESQCEGKMRNAIQIMRQHICFKKNRTVAIFDENFSTIIKDVPHPSPDLCQDCRFFCDVLILCPGNLPIVLSFCDVAIEDANCFTKCKQHNHTIAKLLLSRLRVYYRKLIGLLSYTVTLNGDISKQLDEGLKQESLYPERDRNPGISEITDIMRAFINITGSIPSPFQSLVDGEYLHNILSKDQYRIIYEDFHSQSRLLISGLPGTGKTEIIKELLRKLKSNGVKMKEILYVTEHMPICDVIGRMAMCIVLTRHELTDRWRKRPRLFENIQHIFVDDAQFLQHPDALDLLLLQDWFTILDTIMKDKQGLFWIFHGNHGYIRGPTVEETVQGKPFEKRKLKTIIRNTKRIAEFAEEYAQDNEYKGAVDSIPHEITGEPVQVLYRDLRDEESRYSVFKMLMMQCLKRYAANHIAVLFKSVWDIPKELKCEYDSFRKCVNDQLKYTSNVEPKFVSIAGLDRPLKIVNGSKNEAKDAVVVDSIRRYSSLDRLVVIVIGCNKDFRLQFAAFTRPLAKLVVVHPFTGF